MDQDVAREMVEEFLPRPARSWENARKLAMELKPYARVTIADREMEVISMPFVQKGIAIRGGGAGFGVMVREPDEPTTMREWSIPRAVVRAILRKARS